MKLCHLILFALFLSVSVSSYAQVLDDEDYPNASNLHKSIEEDEAFFNELFKEYSPDERDITQKAEFDDAISEAVDMVKSYSNYVSNQNSSKKKSDEQVSPLENDIYLSLVDGSFKIFKNISGRIQCRFSVKLKSEIDREINVIGLSLAYPKMSFAFIFRDVAPNGELVKSITTRGDICYDLSGAPDININKCKIKNTKSADCAAHIKWDNRT